MTDQEWESAASTLGTITSVPLPEPVRALLTSLQPPRPQGPRRSPRGSTRGRPAVGGELLLDADQAEHSSGGTRPLVGAVHFRGPEGQPLRAWWSGLAAAPPRVTPADARDGRSLAQVVERRVAVRLWLVPDGVRPADLLRGDVLTSGVTEFTWSFGPPLPTPPPETARRRHAGDFTLVDVRGTLVAVHVAEAAGTHLSWRSTLNGATCSVLMRTPFPPVEAVERLARDVVSIPVVDDRTGVTERPG